MITVFSWLDAVSSVGLTVAFLSCNWKCSVIVCTPIFEYPLHLPHLPPGEDLSLHQQAGLFSEWVRFCALWHLICWNRCFSYSSFAFHARGDSLLLTAVVYPYCYPVLNSSTLDSSTNHLHCHPSYCGTSTVWIPCSPDPICDRHSCTRLVVRKSLEHLGSLRIGILGSHSSAYIVLVGGSCSSTYSLQWSIWCISAYDCVWLGQFLSFALCLSVDIGRKYCAPHKWNSFITCKFE